MAVRLVIGTSESLRVGSRPSDVEFVKKNRLVAGRKGCDAPLATLRGGAWLDVAGAHDP